MQSQSVIGGYQIIDTVGAGGMGVVYLAQHQLLGRKAALKVLLPGYSNDPEVVSRFFGEARAATAIKHPGIVRVYDFGYQDDGSAYIAMEFLDGEPLDARLRRLGPMPIQQALRFAGQMASALASAHGHGIVHRDLKPGNVFLVPDPQVLGGERVKLLDFGIAKFAVADDPNSNKTRDGTIMGSPAYMAPEQCRGQPGIDGRADLYSVGCIIFEMLCGRPPFDGNGQGAMAIMSQQLDEAPPVPSSLRPDIRPELDALILFLLAKDPAYRYQSAVDLGTALAAVSGEQVSFSTQPGATGEQGVVPWPPTGSGATGPDGLPLGSSRPGSMPSSTSPDAKTIIDTATRPADPAPRRSRGKVAALLLLLVAGVAAVSIATAVNSGGEAPPAALAVVEAPPPPAPPPAPREPRKPPKPKFTFQQLDKDAPPATGGMAAATNIVTPADAAAPPAFQFQWRLPKVEFSLSSLFTGSLFSDVFSALGGLFTPPRIVTWRVTSSPPGAQVFDGDALIGTTATPLQVTFQETPGYVANLVLRLDGYDDAALALSGTEDYDQTTELVPRIPIEIESRPAGAAIFDAAGKQLGVTPGKVALSRSSEAVPLTLRLEGYEDMPLSVVPDRERKQRLALVKQRAMVTIHLESTPPGAEVLKGDAVLGPTPRDDQFLEEKTRVEYTVRLEGYRPQRVRVAGDRSSSKTIVLRPLKSAAGKRKCPPEEAQAAGSGPTIYDPYKCRE